MDFIYSYILYAADLLCNPSISTRETYTRLFFAPARVIVDVKKYIVSPPAEKLRRRRRFGVSLPGCISPE